MADLSKLSDADLLAVSNGEWEKVSDAGLQVMSAGTQTAPAQPAQPAPQPEQKRTVLGTLLGAKQAFDQNNKQAALGALQEAANVGGNWLQGVKIGANMLGFNPDIMPKEQRQKEVQSFVGQQGAQPESLPFQIGQGAYDVALTAGVPGAVAKPIAGLGKYSPTLAKLAQAVRTGGMEGGNLATRTAGGAIASGAATGAINPENAGTGAVVGGLMPSAIGAISRIVRPQTNQKVLDLMEQGVTPTPGQILGGTANTIEEKMQSVPIVGEAIGSARKKAVEEFNSAALNRALAPIGQKTSKIGREGINEVEDKISSVYNSLLPKLSFIPDQTFNQEIGQLKQIARNFPKQEYTEFNNILGRTNLNTSMSGQALKDAESVLSKEVSAFKNSTDAYQKRLGETLEGVLTSLRNSLSRSNPQYAQELKSANEAWANYTRIRGAASSTAAGANEGVFSPAQLAMAVRAADKSAGKGASAKGAALMQDLAEQGTNVLGSKVADSGTAGRLGYGLGGAAVYANPQVLWGTLGALPYLGPGRNIAAAMLTKRPQTAQAFADALRKGGQFYPSIAATEINKE